MSDSIYFLIEDSQDGVAIENGGEAMDYIVDEGNEFNLKHLTNLTGYKKLHPNPIELDPEDESLENRMLRKRRLKRLFAENRSNNYTEDQKTLFLYNLKIKIFSAAKSGRLAGI